MNNADTSYDVSSNYLSSEWNSQKLGNSWKNLSTGKQQIKDCTSPLSKPCWCPLQTIPFNDYVEPSPLSLILTWSICWRMWQLERDVLETEVVVFHNNLIHRVEKSKVTSRCSSKCARSNYSAVQGSKISRRYTKATVRSWKENKQQFAPSVYNQGSYWGHQKVAETKPPLINQ